VGVPPRERSRAGGEELPGLVANAAGGAPRRSLGGLLDTATGQTLPGGALVFRQVDDVAVAHMDAPGNLEDTTRGINPTGPIGTRPGELPYPHCHLTRWGKALCNWTLSPFPTV
jgi:hypothetical protein